jgi:hypothetical protein
MEMGLGIWSDEGTRGYYSVSTIRAKGRCLTDQVEGKNLLVFLDPLTSTSTSTSTPTPTPTPTPTAI